jgi:hypothetical protein
LKDDEDRTLVTRCIHDQLGYEAQGYLGQYLNVTPRDRLVAVRQRRYRKSANPDADPQDSKRNFGEFAEMVAALVDKLPAKP